MSQPPAPATWFESALRGAEAICRGELVPTDPPPVPDNRFLGSRARASATSRAPGLDDRISG